MNQNIIRSLASCLPGCLLDILCVFVSKIIPGEHYHGTIGATVPTYSAVP